MFPWALGLVLVAPWVAAAPPAAVVGSVNGDPITAQCYVEALRRHRTREPDVAALHQAALHDCIRFAVILQLARREGVIANVSDAGLRSLWMKENDRRARTLAAGGIIYGPRHLTWEQYRSYWLDGVLRDLTVALARTAGPESDAQLAHFLEEHAARFTPHGGKTPQPLSAQRDHVRAEYRRDACERAIRRAIARANVVVDAPVAARLTPNTVP
ncbi:MAG TPA: hypothetical protein VHE61_08285 [Opitutaceae bacterium]|nr:hypothetical protein [Opitutaceae bacterium]